MSELGKAVRVGIDGVFYSLAHVPDLVRYGSKPLREIRANPALGHELKEKLRDFRAAVAYARHQAYMVTALVRSREAESAIVTQLLVPLKERAEPNLPDAFQVALLIEPLLLLPDTSLTTVPVPSLKL